MPSADNHRTKADKNRAFLATICHKTHPEWAVTVIFYCAVHNIERLRAAQYGEHSKDHRDRIAFVQSVCPLIHSEYKTLEVASRIARYFASSDFFKHITIEEIKAKLIDDCLVKIEDFTDRTLGVTPRRR